MTITGHDFTAGQYPGLVNISVKLEMLGVSNATRII